MRRRPTPTRRGPTPTRRGRRAQREYARQLYTSDMFAIQQVWEAGNIGRMGELLGRHPTRPGQTDCAASSGMSSRGFMKSREPSDPDAAARGAVWNLAATRTVRPWPLDLRPREGPGSGHLWMRTAGCADVRRPQGTEGTFKGPWPSPRTDVSSHEEPIRSRGPERPFINLWYARRANCGGG